MNLTKLRLIEKRIGLQQSKLMNSFAVSPRNVTLTEVEVEQALQNFEKIQSELFNNLKKGEMLATLSSRIRLAISKANSQNGVDELLTQIHRIDKTSNIYTMIGMRAFNDKEDLNALKDSLLSRIKNLREKDSMEISVYPITQGVKQKVEQSMKELSKERTKVEDQIAIINAKTIVDFEFTEEEKALLEEMDIVI